MFVDNGYPKEAVQHIIQMKTHKSVAKLAWADFNEGTNIQEEAEVDYSKVLSPPYHPPAHEMCKVLKKSFNINCVHKKTIAVGYVSS